MTTKKYIAGASALLLIIGLAVVLVAPEKPTATQARIPAQVGDSIKNAAQSRKSRPANGAAPDPGQLSYRSENPARIRNLADIVEDLNSLSKSHSGLDLQQKQLDFLTELASSNKLSTPEMCLLIEELHFSVGDSALHPGWIILLSSLVSREDFKLDKWLASLEKGPLTTDVVGLAGAAWADMGFQLKAEDVRAMEKVLSDVDFKKMLAAYSRKMTSADPISALNFATEYRSKIGDDAYSAVIVNLGSDEAYKSISGAVLKTREPPASKKVVMSVASGWVAVNPTAATHWVDSIQDPVIRGSAAEAMIKRWAATDIQSAAKWLAATNLGGLDAAIGSLVQSMSRYTPAEAKKWAQLIKDPNIRENALRDIK